MSLIFYYVYRPDACCTGPMDGGFNAAVYDEGYVQYTAFNASRQPVQSLRFPISEEAAACVRVAVGSALPFLRQMPPNLACGRMPQYSSLFGAENTQIAAEELGSLIAAPFADPVGQAARHLYLLLEDVAAQLLPCGLKLEITSLLWNTRMTAPM